MACDVPAKAAAHDGFTAVTSLRDFTMARVGLERSGAALATREVLAFRMAHAMARDAVNHPLDAVGLELECAAHHWPVLRIRSRAGDRISYLRRPDLGRTVDEQSLRVLETASGSVGRDLTVAIVDGLSALAVNRHVVQLLSLLLPRFEQDGWSRTELVVVEQGRVAIGDEIGSVLHSRLVLVLIGERPGLSSPDSLGAYLTWNPAPGRTDAERNCISNIRPEGLEYQAAADRIFALASEARRRQLTGIALKENRAAPPDGRALPG